MILTVLLEVSGGSCQSLHCPLSLLETFYVAQLPNTHTLAPLRGVDLRQLAANNRIVISSMCSNVHC